MSHIPHEPPRSSQWPAVRLAWLATNRCCAFCGGYGYLEVHHIRPFHLFPQFELDPANFVTLCEGRGLCHLHIGHLGDWRSFNPRLIGDQTLSQIPGSMAFRHAVPPA